jgi:cystathionine gamma-synthase
MLATSLTKFFSGAGDVMGGSLVLNPNRPLYGELKRALEHEFEDLLFADDAVVLEQNSRDVVERVRKINRNAEELCESIRRHPAVAAVNYPAYNTVENYRAFLRDGGEYGGLFSMLLHNPAANAPAFFDALQIGKGPNLGTNFSLCCPYTILAHYRELDFAERCGVSPYLLRVSVGLEDIEWLKARFRGALDSLL